MDKPSKMNERLTLIANIAVVIGIVFLALEMRQNTDMMRAQIRDSLTERVNDTNMLLASSPELAAVMANIVAASEGRAATEEDLEAVSFFGYAQAVLRAYEDEYFQYQEGLFGEAEMESRRWNWRFLLGTSALAEGVRGVWAQNREGYPPGFRAEIDAIVAEIEN